MGSRAMVVLMAMSVEALADWQVWTLAETRRVLRDEPSTSLGPGPAGQSVEVKLAAARNETRGFQILLRSDQPVKGINIQPGNLGLVGKRDFVIAAGDVRLYRQHQLEIKEGTYRNDAFKPGW